MQKWLKIAKNESINLDKVESISEYVGSPLRVMASRARKKKEFREFRGRYGVKTLILFADGYVMLAPYRAETYIEKLEKDNFLIIDPKRHLINKEYVREISTKPNAQQREEIKEAKKNGMFVNLAGNKPAKIFVFTTTGRIYSARWVKEDITN